LHLKQKITSAVIHGLKST